MLKITLLSIIVIAALLYVAEPKINLYPFKVQFTKGWFALGMALIGLGIGLVRYQGYKDGVAEGVKETFEYLKKEIKKEGV